MKKLAILPCGKRKIWDRDPVQGKMAVRDVYIGTLHRLTRTYAESFADEWVILSAKHGYCFPDELIAENYDLTFGTKDKHAIISNQALIDQINKKQLDQYDRIIVLTGQKHKKIVEQTFPEKDVLSFPLLGTKGIGEMQHLLKHAIENKVPLD